MIRKAAGAVAWTVLQHLSFFAMAWGVSHAAGAAAFGELGQALALAAVLSVAVTMRFEYAAQLESRPALSGALFFLARALAWGAGLGAALLAFAAWRAGLAPAWVCAGAWALTPMAGLQVAAARRARAGCVAHAAALRAAPALAMLPLQAVAAAWGGPDAMVWTLPVAAWLCLLLPAGGALPPRPPLRLARLVRSRLRFVRNEWLGLLLNVSANHGQVLLVGALAGPAAAGAMALALRIAMLPTSLFGLTLGDWLRVRVVAGGGTARALVVRAVRWMAGLSLGVHGVAAVAAWVALPWFFPAQGEALRLGVLALLPLGAVRLVASPLAFLLPWRGWLGLSLLGQCLLFAAAIGAVYVGLGRGGVPGVAAAYTAGAFAIYAGYIAFGLRAVRPDTRGFGN